MGKRELARVGDRMSTGKSRRAGTHATQRNPSVELCRSARNPLRPSNRKESESCDKQW